MSTSPPASAGSRRQGPRPGPGPGPGVAVRTRLSGCRVLVAPGLRGSGPHHWQSTWQKHHPDFLRVQQDDWSHPELDGWAARVAQLAERQAQPVVVAAHSFGCLATVRAAARQPGLIAAALLVAPADPQRFGIESRLLSAAPDCPTLLVASRNDPWLPLEAARVWGDRWHSVFASLGEAGHINAESGYGEWPEGLMMLDWLCRRVQEKARL